MLLPFDVLSQSKKAEDPKVPLRKLSEEVGGNVSKNVSTLAEGGLRVRRQRSKQKTKTRAPTCQLRSQKPDKTCFINLAIILGTKQKNP